MKKLLILLFPITMFAQSNSFKPYHAPIDSIMQIIHDNLKLNQYIIKLDTPNYISFKDYFKKINDSIKLNPSILEHILIQQDIYVSKIILKKLMIQ